MLWGNRILLWPLLIPSCSKNSGFSFGVGTSKVWEKQLIENIARFTKTVVCTFPVAALAQYNAKVIEDLDLFDCITHCPDIYWRFAVWGLVQSLVQ